MSGGRATVGLKKGKTFSNQAGDISAVSAEGLTLTSRYLVESKFYKKLDIEAFCLTGKGALGRFWKETLDEAKKHKREPLLIARQNRTQELVIMRPPAFKSLIGNNAPSMSIRVRSKSVTAELRYLSDVLACAFKG